MSDAVADLPMPPPEVLADPAFHACLEAASSDFLDAILRLRRIPEPARDPIGRLIDETTGLTGTIARELVGAVYDLLYRRLSPDVLAELRSREDHV